MNIGSRLSSALSVKNIKTKDIVDKFNITQQQVSNIKKADKVNDTIASIAIHYNINLNWLLTGEGKMFIEKDTSNTQNINNQNGNSVFTNSGTMTNTMTNQSPSSSNIDKVTQVLFEEAYKNASKNEESLKKLKLLLMDF